MERLNATVFVFSGIVSNLTVPTNSSGIARSIGGQLVNDTSLTGPVKQQKARELLAYVQGELLPKEQWNLDARAHYKQTLQLTLANKLPSLNSYNEPFKKAGYFIDTVRKPGTAYPYTSYLGGYASVTNPTTTPILGFDNRFWRISGKSDGTKETETITVPELGGITMGGFDGTRLYIGGPNVGFSQFETSEQRVMRVACFRDGGRMGWESRRRGWENGDVARVVGGRRPRDGCDEALIRSGSGVGPPFRPWRRG